MLYNFAKVNELQSYSIIIKFLYSCIVIEVTFNPSANEVMEGDSVVIALKVNRGIAIAFSVTVNLMDVTAKGMHVQYNIMSYFLALHIWIHV